MNASRILDDKGREVVTLSADASLLDAAGLLTQHRIGATVVADSDGLPQGVFSERDLARALAQSGAMVLSEPVSSVMTRDLITATESASVDSLMSIMTEKRVRHVLIMDGPKLSGIVSIGDVVKRKIAQAEAEAESLKSYIETS